MPTINLTGSSGGNDPRQNKGAAFAAYEKSQADAAKKTTQRDSAFDRHDKELDAQLSKLKKQEVDELKAHMAQQKQERAREAQLFRQEMAARNSHLAQEKQRENQHNQAQRILRRSEDMAARRAARNDPQTYRLQNIDQLGRSGMRYAERDDWKGLVRTEYELSNIQRKFGNTPGAAAALARARGMIGAGGQGNPGWMNRAGRVFGSIGEHGLLRGGGLALGGSAGYMAGGIAGIAFQALKGAFNLPSAISGIAQGMMGDAKPAMDLRSSLSAIGRSGGTDSESLRRELTGNPEWMRRYGLTASGSADLLQQYGITPTMPGEAVNNIRSIAGSAYNMGMNPGDIAGMAGRATNLGLTGGNTDEYLRKVQKVTQTAVSQGMDKSQATSVLEGLYKQATTSNTATLGSGQGISDLWTRMMQAGTPSARSGMSAASLIQGADQFANDIGFNTGNPARAQVMGAYIQRQGGAKAFTGDDAYRKLMGEDRFNNLVSTPGGRESLRLAKQAAANGDVNLLSHNMSPLIAGDAEAVRVASEGSGLFNDMPPGYKTVAMQNIAGAGQQAFNDRTATAGLKAAKPPPTGPQAQEMYQKLIAQGYPPKAAADMVANAWSESGFDPAASNNIGGGHYGLFQLGQTRQALFKQVMGHAIQGSSADDQLAFNNWELNNTEKTAGDMLRGGISAPGDASVFSQYDERPGRTPRQNEDEAAVRGDLRDRLQKQLADNPNSNASVNRVTSDVGKVGMNASETSYQRLSTGDQQLGDVLIGVSNGAEKLNEAFLRLASTVGGLVGLSRGSGAMPSGPRASAVAPASLPNPYDTFTLGLG